MNAGDASKTNDTRRPPSFKISEIRRLTQLLMRTSSDQNNVGNIGSGDNGNINVINLTNSSATDDGGDTNCETIDLT